MKSCQDTKNALVQQLADQERLLDTMLRAGGLPYGPGSGPGGLPYGPGGQPGTGILRPAQIIIEGPTGPGRSA
jgi:hypothetical protein